MVQVLHRLNVFEYLAIVSGKHLQHQLLKKSKNIKLNYLQLKQNLHFSEINSSKTSQFTVTLKLMNVHVVTLVTMHHNSEVL